jgi:hypothetical protein
MYECAQVVSVIFVLSDAARSPAKAVQTKPIDIKTQTPIFFLVES